MEEYCLEKAADEYRNQTERQAKHLVEDKKRKEEIEQFVRDQITKAQIASIAVQLPENYVKVEEGK